MTPLPKDPTGTSRLAYLIRQFNRALRERTPLKAAKMELMTTPNGFHYRPRGGGAGGPTSEDEEGPEIKQFSFVSMGNDIVVCHPIDDAGVITQTPTAIAKPWRLRRTPFHNVTVGGVRYTYSAGNQRTATDPINNRAEPQTIVPAYWPADIIVAVKNVEGFGDGSPYRVTGDPAVEEGNVYWLDMNVDGRAWASRFTVP